MILSAVFLLGGCTSSSPSNGQFFTVADAGWHYDQTFTLNAERDTMFEKGDIIDLTVRHTGGYSYANLWVELSYTSNDSVVADTFNIAITDNYGKWIGRGSGSIITRTESLSPRLTPDCNSQFGVRHIMRVDVLDDVEQIGIVLRKPESDDSL